jgi:hypothetical protein
MRASPSTRCTLGNTVRTLTACGSIWLAACKGTEPFVPTPTAVLISPDMVSLTALGATRQFSAVVQDQRGDPIATSRVTWATTDPAVATIDSTGFLTAVGVGAVQVRATVVTTPSLVGTAGVAVAQLPARIQKVSGDFQTDTIAHTLLTALVVQVNDALDHPIVGVVVGFEVTLGGGTIAATEDTTDADGRASATWTLGNAAGVNAVSASVGEAGVSGNPALFTAYGVVPDSAPTVTVFSGDGQAGLVGYAVNVPPAVLVRDIDGAPQAGLAVNFQVASGGGSLSGATAVTDASGVARVGSWTLTQGSNSLTATVDASGPLLGNPVTFTAIGTAAAYHIDVRFLTAMIASQRAAFENAAAKWETLIFGDLPDVAVSLAAGNCGSNSPAVNETIDDIVIFASIDSIDGLGNILGQAGYCVRRNNSQLPLLGVMEFDSADVVQLQNDGQFELVIEHEMGHVLGFGTIWSRLGLLSGAGTSDPSFTGQQARAAFDGIGGSAYIGAKVPVENCCGSGTRDSHWRESVLGTELMTGFIDAGANPLSVLTTASMGDLGYQVNYAGSEPFVLIAAFRAPSKPALRLAHDILSLPIRVVDQTGRVVEIIPP